MNFFHTRRFLLATLHLRWYPWQNMQRKIFAFIFLLPLSASWTAPTAHAADPLRFLQDSSQIQVQQDQAGNPAIFTTSDGHEAYWAIDAFGNPYQLTIKAPRALMREIAASFLAEALGLPNRTVYPLLIKRGVNGVPTAEQVKATGAYREPLIGENGQWFAATVQPAGPLPTSALGDLNTEQKLSYLKHLIFNFITGNSPDHNLGGSVSLYGEHIFTTDLSQSFLFTTDDSLPLLSGLNFARGELKQIGAELNRFIAKLEVISKAQNLIEPLIEMHLGETELDGKDLPGEIIRRIAKVKAAFATQIESRQWIVWPRPASPPLPTVNLPKQKITSHHIFDLTERTLSEGLWAYYFQPDPLVQNQALSQWRATLSELGMATEDPIATIQGFISQSPASKNYYIGPAIIYTKPERVPQVNLNPLNPKTMVICPLNDDEAYAIADLTTKSGALLYPVRALHGVKLEDLPFGTTMEIKHLVRKYRIERIVTVELPERTLGYEKQFREKIGIKEFIVVDHHSYENLDRAHRHSSLEQVAHILGYKPNSRETIIGINDRSFAYGLIDLGISREEFLKIDQVNKINSRVMTHGRHSLKEFFQIIETPYGPLYVTYNESIIARRVGDVVLSLLSEDFKIVSILFIGSRKMRYSGTPKLIPFLTKVGQAWEGSVQAHFSGGDKNLSMFWGLKGIKPSDIFQIQAEALAAVANPAFDPYDFFIKHALAQTSWGSKTHILEALIDHGSPQALTSLKEHMMALPFWKRNSRLIERIGGKEVTLDALKGPQNNRDCPPL